MNQQMYHSAPKTLRKQKGIRLSYRQNIALFALMFLILSVLRLSAQQIPSQPTEENPDLIWLKKGHDDQISFVHFLPDGQTFVTTGFDGAINIWRSTDGELIRTMSHGAAINSATLSQDGTVLACEGANDEVSLWNPQTGTLLRRIAVRSNLQYSSISSDGRYLVSLSQWIEGVQITSQVQMWDVESGKLLQEYDKLNAGTTTVALSTEGKYIAASTTDGEIVIWQRESGTIAKILSGKAGIRCMRFSPDGMYLAAAGNRNDDNIAPISLWRTADWEQQSSLLGHTKRINNIDFSSGSSFLVSASDDGMVGIWDMNSYRQIYNYIYMYNGFASIQYSVAISPDSTVILSSSGPGFFLWKAQWSTTLVHEQANPTDIQMQIIPNPSTASSVLKFNAPSGPVTVRVSITNMQGREIATVCEQSATGEQNIALQASTERLAAGTYFCRVQVGHHTTVQPFIISR